MQEERKILKILAAVQGMISMQDGVATLPDGKHLDLREIGGLVPPPAYHGKDQVPAGKAGQLVTLEGAEITGTAETIPATAIALSATRREDGTLEVQYEGQTDVDWDGQKTLKTPNGQRLYVTDSGEWVPESHVMLVPYDHGDDDEENVS